MLENRLSFLKVEIVALSVYVVYREFVTHMSDEINNNYTLNNTT